MQCNVIWCNCNVCMYVCKLCVCVSKEFSCWKKNVLVYMEGAIFCRKRHEMQAFISQAPYGSLWQFTAAVASPEFEDADHPQLVDFPLPWKCINIFTCVYIYMWYIYGKQGNSPEKLWPVAGANQAAVQHSGCHLDESLGWPPVGGSFPTASLKRETCHCADMCRKGMPAGLYAQFYTSITCL